MEQYKNYQKVMLIGDKSKYIFLKEYIRNEVNLNLSIEELEHFNIYVSYDNRSYFELYDDIKTLVIKLKINPITKLLWIPKDIFDLEKTEVLCEKMLVMTSFPYLKIDVFEDVDYISSKFKLGQIEGIIFKEDRRFSLTDLSNEGEAIKNIVQKYYDLGIESKIIEEGKKEDYISLFTIKPNLRGSFEKVYIKKFKDAKKNFDANYKNKYSIEIISFFNIFTILNPDEFERFNTMFEYNSLNVRKTIWENYIEKFKQQYMEGEFGVIDKINEFINGFVYDIKYWDDNILEESTQKYIIKIYKAYFKKEKIELKVPDNELEYIKIKNNYRGGSLEKVFKDRLKNFVEELEQKLQKYIENIFKSVGIE